jgi:hypothetical protein
MSSWDKKKFGDFLLVVLSAAGIAVVAVPAGV